MKRLLKFFFISLTSLILLLAISISVVLWIAFSPDKLTPMVRNQTEKYIPYLTETGKVELTFFSTFPKLGIKLSDFAIISPVNAATSDTLLNADELIAVMDAKAFLNSNELIISQFIMADGSLNIFIDSLGNSNYMLLLTESSTEAGDPSSTDYGFIDLEKIEFKNLNLSYTDQSDNLKATLTDLTGNVDGVIRGDNFTGHINLNNAGVSIEYDGQRYLELARLKFEIPSEINISRQIIQLKEAFVSINGLGFTVNGTIEIDTLSNNINTDIRYRSDSWNIQDALALIPPEYMSDFSSLDASGIISSAGIVKGIYSDSLMPLMDINLTFNQGAVKYDDLPFPLTEMNGDIQIYADLNNHTPSHLRIHHLEAKTPFSAFKTSGTADDLLGDIHFNLLTDADVLVDEFKSFIPDDLNISINGRISGQVKSNFTMSQADELALDKMKLSGSASLYSFSMVYDSLYMATDTSRIEFSLPNPVVSDRNTKFASVDISSGNLTVSQIDDFSTSLKNSRFYMEFSDIRDTSQIPDLFCTFSMDSIWGEMDTIHIAVQKPLGYFTLAPVPEAPDRPVIQLAYSSFGVNAQVGKDLVVIEDITFRTDIVNDNTREDLLLQWMANGFLEMNNGSISMSTLSYPVEIPAIKMDFNPETFHIHESSVKIDQSDFGLTGTLNNVLSYFKGDSILRGDFDFSSGHTDLDQLMSLTSGFGSEENVEEDTAVQADSNDSTAGPYMVPKGIDILLKASVKKASMGGDTSINILGNVRVNDGILVLDGLKLTTPAADMQLTAMYRTPRKNHLYLGLDYHLFDVEISRLLQMIPDIDTLMPMLRSFGGSGEFHIAIETYLDSLYNIKESTLRGASSIKGENLVLMDGETFSEIAKTLRFSKRAENRVDSLSAEFTIFRNEIDIYPFLIVMDRYKAVVAGRHNFDLSYDYHISLVESPLPVRIGVDIKGSEEDMQYRPVSPKYAQFYRPTSRRAVESRQLELRKMIREALLENVR